MLRTHLQSNAGDKHTNIPGGAGGAGFNRDEIKTVRLPDNGRPRCIGLGLVHLNVNPRSIEWPGIFVIGGMPIVD